MESKKQTKQNRNRFIDTENKLVVARQGGRWEKEVKKTKEQIPIYKITKSQEHNIQSKEYSQ